MKIDGACLCGQLTYEAEVDPQRVAICHCTDCQINSASAMGWVVAVTDDRFELKSGTLKTFVKTAESGRRRVLGFCPQCGTRIYAKPAEGEEGFFGLRAGSIRQRAELKPRIQLWAQSAQPWLAQLPDIPKMNGQPS